MLEQFEMEQTHTVFTACRACRAFRAVCLDGNTGFCCAFGEEGDHFIPFVYPQLDDEGRRNEIGKYERNRLPDDCLFHTQCSMLNFMDDGSGVDEALEQTRCEVVWLKAKELDMSGRLAADLLKVDSSVKKWIEENPDADAAVLKRDGGWHGLALMKMEKDCDYSWISPPPSKKHWFRDGESRLCVRAMVADETVQNAFRMLLSLAYLKAVEGNAEELYVFSYGFENDLLEFGGFRNQGFHLGGEGKDEENAARLMVKKVHDLEEN